MDTDRPDDRSDDNRADDNRADDEARDVFEVSADVDQTYESEPAAAAPKSRMLLATLAGIVVVLVGAGVWAALYLAMDKQFPGISVVFALVIGWAVREVSRRSDMAPRILAALLAVVLCVVGTLAVEAAATADAYKASFVDVFLDLVGANTWVILRRLHWLTWLIFAAAVVVAYASAMPVRPKQPKKPKREEPADVPPTG